MRRYAGALAAAALVAACAKTETPEQMDTRIGAESQAARTAIEAATASFVTHFNAGHADSVVQHYMPSAVVMQPNDRTLTGRDSIRAALSQMMGWGTWRLTNTVQSVAANGPIAIVRGRWSMTFTPGANAPMPAMSDSGKFLTHYHRVGDQWLMAEDIWNSDIPLPPPPPRRRG